MPLSITFHAAKPGQTAYACASLYLIGKRFALVNGFVLAKSRNAACAAWEKICPEKDERLIGATALHTEVTEIADHEGITQSSELA